MASTPAGRQSWLPARGRFSREGGKLRGRGGEQRLASIGVRPCRGEVHIRLPRFRGLPPGTQRPGQLEPREHAQWTGWLIPAPLGHVAELGRRARVVAEELVPEAADVANLRPG